MKVRRGAGAQGSRREIVLRAITVTTAGVAAVAIAATLSSAQRPTPTPKTAAAKSTAASPDITASGSVTAATERNLGFSRGGRLTSVVVKVGDRVEAGDVLATVDDAPARLVLAEQLAQLEAQDATLDQLKDSPSAEGAEDALDQAKEVRDAVREQVESQRADADAAVAGAAKQLTADEQDASRARANRDAACSQSGSSPACTIAQADFAAAQQQVASSRVALSTATQRRDAGPAAGQLVIANAEQGVIAARNAADMANADKPHVIDQQEAMIEGAKAAVRQARRDLEDTTLRAPAAGTVTALNGAVGEYVMASTGTSALAPGSESSLPGASGSTSGGTPSAMAAALGGASRPGGVQFLVLSDLEQLEVVASFNEEDVAHLAPGQQAQVRFDAIPELATTGAIASVAPSGVSQSGVISYYVTVSLGTDDPRIKPGQTAHVSVERQKQ